MDWKGKKLTNSPEMLFDVSRAFYLFALPFSRGLVAELPFSRHFVVGHIPTP